MHTPTTTQLRTAIEVLARLGERLDQEAAHAILQLPETQLGVYYARHIELRKLEQTSRIESVAAQLRNWHDESVEPAGMAKQTDRQLREAFEDLKKGAEYQWCDTECDANIPVSA